MFLNFDNIFVPKILAPPLAEIWIRPCIEVWKIELLYRLLHTFKLKLNEKTCKTKIRRERGRIYLKLLITLLFISIISYNLSSPYELRDTEYPAKPDIWPYTRIGQDFFSNFLAMYAYRIFDSNPEYPGIISSQPNIGYRFGYPAVYRTNMPSVYHSPKNHYFYFPNMKQIWTNNKI